MKNNKPSHTAYKVAINILMLGVHPKVSKDLPKEMVTSTKDLLVKSKIISQKVANFAHSKWALFFQKLFNWLMPGQFESFGYRKLFMEQQTRKAIAEGASQVLSLGAGYDTLTWRLAREFPSVKFFEIDHPPTSLVKKTGLLEMGMPSNLSVIPKDLSQNKLSDVLKENNNWDPGQRSLIIAEGLLMYLTEKSVKELFSQCNQMVGASSLIAFTYVGCKEDGSLDAGPYSSFILKSLKKAGEPWLWCADEAAFSRVLEGTKWKLCPQKIEREDKSGIEYLGLAEIVESVEN